MIVLAGAAGCGGSQESIEVAPAPTLTLAVIGDTPYGDEQLASFPTLVESINSQGSVDLVLHLGDIKTGGSPCDVRYYRHVRMLLDSFAFPVLYTPGDNEWTDCHRPAAGGHVPTERLARLRRVFFARPGMSLGGEPEPVRTQARGRGRRGVPENVLWSDRDVVVSMLHVVGSDNGREPWFEGNETARQTATRQAEVTARVAADLAWIDETFREATRSDAAAVVLAMQADMFAGARAGGYARIVARLTRRARAFDGAVLLLNGDTHQYLVDRPVAAPNVTRIVVQGETTAEWLRVEVDPQAARPFTPRRRTVS